MKWLAPTILPIASPLCYVGVKVIIPRLNRQQKETSKRVVSSKLPYISERKLPQKGARM